MLEPEAVAEDVHEDDGDEGDSEAELTLSLLALLPAQHLASFPARWW